MDSLITFAAKYLLLVSIIGIVYLFYRLKPATRKELAILLVAGGILSLVLSRAGHSLYYDPRPFISDGTAAIFSSSRDNGFPSHHTFIGGLFGFRGV